MEYTDIRKEIEVERQNLSNLIIEKSSLTTTKIINASQKLDHLIKKYYDICM